MRYLGETYAIATLRRGRSIEQFLGPKTMTGDGSGPATDPPDNNAG